MTLSERPTIEDVAKVAGVSTATVSRVVNKSGTVTAVTTERVLAAVEALHYVPHASARELAGVRPRVVGLMFPGIGDAFLTALLSGIEAELAAEGYDLLLYAVLDHDGRPRHVYRPLGEHNTAGLIVFAHSLDESELRRFYERGFPLVLLHQSSPEGLQIPSVTFENKQGAQSAVAHLLQCGRRRIVHLRGPEENEDAYWRELGYRAALAAHNLPVEAELVVLGDFDDVVAETAVSNLLAAGIPFDGIFAGDDESARGALLALQEAGVRVPDDVAVVGFDDASYARYLTPALTTVRAPIELSGRQAAAQLIHLIRGEPAEPLVLLPTELIVRESCGVVED